MITLGAVTLPADLTWTDEFSGFGVGQIITPTLTTALVVEETAQSAGRRITLQGDNIWIARSVVLALDALSATALDDTTLLLTLDDGRTFDVVFDRSRGAGFEAQEVFQLAGGDQTADHQYTITLRLITA